jgi:hypothetical protein
MTIREETLEADVERLTRERDEARHHASARLMALREVDREMKRLENLRAFDTDTTPLPKGVMLEYTRLDGMWQQLVRERDELKRQVTDIARERDGHAWAADAWCRVARDVGASFEVVDAAYEAQVQAYLREGVHLPASPRKDAT